MKRALLRALLVVQQQNPDTGYVGESYFIAPVSILSEFRERIYRNMSEDMPPGNAGASLLLAWAWFTNNDQVESLDAARFEEFRRIAFYTSAEPVFNVYELDYDNAIESIEAWDLLYSSWRLRTRTSRSSPPRGLRPRT